MKLTLFLSACLHGFIESPVQQGRDRHHVESVLFSNLPCNAWRMSSRVSENPEETFHQVHEPLVLALLRICRESIEGKNRVGLLAHPERLVNQLPSIACKPRFVSDLLGDALGSLKNGVKVVAFHELCSTEC